MKKTEFKKNPTQLEMLFTPDFEKMIEIVFYNSLGFFFYGFLMAYVSMQILETSGLELGIVFSIQVVGGIISGPIAGYLTDKIEKKKLVLFGANGRALAYLATYIAIYYRNYIILLISVFLLGFLVGFFWTPFDALVSEKSSKECRSLAFGKRSGKIGTGNLLGTIIGVAIFSLGNYIDPNNYLIVYFPLIIYAASNVYGGYIFNKYTNESVKYDDLYKEKNRNTDPLCIETAPGFNLEMRMQTQQEQQKFNGLISLSLGLIILLLGFLVSKVNQSITQPLIQGYIIRNLEDNPTLVMFASFPGEVLAQLFSPILGDKADRINPIKGMAFVCFFGALNTWLLIRTHSLFIFMLLLISDLTLSRTGELILQNFLSRVSKQHRGKIFGIRRSITDLGGAAGPIIGGILWDTRGMRSPFITSIYIELSLITIYILAIRLLSENLAEKTDKK
jgi:MFS family permease